MDIREQQTAAPFFHFHRVLTFGAECVMIITKGEIP